MRIELTEVTWLEEQVLSFGELTELSGLPPGLLEELVQAGAITPIEQPAAREQSEAPEPPDARGALPVRGAHYSAVALAAARHARRLREDFELDDPALLLVLALCDRVDELEARLQEMQAKLPRRARMRL
jgi:chaperone modulatory protein CbpM